MRFPEWEPIYEEIAREFGFDRKSDEEARDLLRALLADRDSPESVLRAAFAGRVVAVVGAGRPVDPARLPAPVVVADKAVAAFVAAGGAPALVVSDLDGDLPAIEALSARGVPVAVAAHGDNRDALAAWVPRLRGPLLGTTQVAPIAPLVNVGGFTDGDRACFLAAWLGAREIALAGFDFERAPTERKRAKLAWARRLVGRVGVPVRTLP